jgi:hypothetical protein
MPSELSRFLVAHCLKVGVHVICLHWNLSKRLFGIAERRRRAMEKSDRVGCAAFGDLRYREIPSFALNRSFIWRSQHGWPGCSIRFSMVVNGKSITRATDKATSRTRKVERSCAHTALIGHSNGKSRLEAFRRRPERRRSIDRDPPASETPHNTGPPEGYRGLSDHLLEAAISLSADPASIELPGSDGRARI